MRNNVVKHLQYYPKEYMCLYHMYHIAYTNRMSLFIIPDLIGDPEFDLDGFPPTRE